MSGQVFTSDSIPGPMSVEADVCVVGSGAGGAVAAATLSAKGLKVVILEEGGFYTKKDFTMREAEMFAKLYQDRGNRATDDLSMVIMQGRSVGGGTTINVGTMIRTPDSTLDHWKQVYGLQRFSNEDLRAAFDEIEARLHVIDTDITKLDRVSKILWDGAEALGLHPEPLRRNVKNCDRLGYCTIGCPSNAKLGMHLTYLQDALRNGADIYSNCRVELLDEGALGQITAVRARIMDESKYSATGVHVVIRPKAVILAGGAINSPGLLLKSRLRDRSGLTGKRIFMHPILITVGKFAEPVNPFKGVPEEVVVHRNAEPGRGHYGYFIETASVRPRLAAIGVAGFGQAHREMIEDLPYLHVLSGHIVDGFTSAEDGASVELKEEGGFKVDYAYTADFWKTAKTMMKEMARIHLAAGATEVTTGHEVPVRIRSEADLPSIDQAPIGPQRALIVSTHQLGGCMMGSDPDQSVINPDLRHWSYENLYVMDSSIFPTSLGVNPQETIMAFAKIAAENLAAVL